jgi:tetratricopeptide (TPR) repeat protein
LLSTLRAFAARGLVAESVRTDAERRHSRYFGRAGLRLARRALRGDPTARAELASDLDNLFAAHAAAIANGDAMTALSCAIAASPVLTTEGPLGPCVSMLDEALACPGASEAPRALSAAAHAARALAALLTGDADAATASAARAIEIARALGEPLLMARVLRQAAKVDLMRSRWEPAKSALLESLELARRAGDRHGEGWSVAGLGDLAFYVDDLDEASKLYEDARLLFQGVGDRSASAVLRFHVGSVAVERAQPEIARQHLEAALSELALVGERRTACYARGFLAILDQSDGRLDAARAGFMEAIAMARRIDFRRCEGTMLGYLAGCLLEEGEIDEAVARYREAFTVLEGSGSTIGVYFRAALGAALAMRGELAAAQTELDAARALLGSTSQQTFAAAVISIHAGHLALARMARAESEEDRAALLEQARSALAVDGALASQSDVRFARRVLQSRMAGTPEVNEAVTSIVIADSGRWFRHPGGQSVDLSRRRSLRLVLQALAQHRLQAAGGALDIAEIAAIGWPGETILPDAATERVYTVVATLRRLGLRNALMRRDDGYLLDPLVPVLIAPEKEG